MFLGTYNLAGAVTFSGLLLALAACMLSFHHQLPWAMACLISSGICDLFDGWVARKLNRSETEKAFGVQIDSLADMAAFGLTPVVILLHDGFDGPVDFIFFAVYLCAAAMRLAYFNQTRAAAQTPLATYTGLPVTYAALIFPVLLLPAKNVTPPGFHWIVRITLSVTALLFVLRIPVPKPRGWAYVVFIMLAVALTVAWLVTN